jgi:DNA-binding transcriptional MerR regulator
MLAATPGINMNRLTLAQLCKAAGASVRQVRNYISKGAVDPPDGRTSSARYARRHVLQVSSTKRALSRGATLAEIAAERHALPRKARGSTVGLDTGLLWEGAVTTAKVQYVTSKIYIVFSPNLSPIEQSIKKRIDKAAQLGLKERSDLLLSAIREGDERGAATDASRTRKRAAARR